jgi:hypothetical protein
MQNRPFGTSPHKSASDPIPPENTFDGQWEHFSHMQEGCRVVRSEEVRMLDNRDGSETALGGPLAVNDLVHAVCSFCWTHL